MSGPINAIRPGMLCGQGWGEIFSRGQPPQDNGVGSGVVWVTGLFSLCVISHGYQGYSSGRLYFQAKSLVQINSKENIRMPTSHPWAFVGGSLGTCSFSWQRRHHDFYGHLFLTCIQLNSLWSNGTIWWQRVWVKSLAQLLRNYVGLSAFTDVD